MKRAFLEELGLTKEQINSIMAINGEDIEKAKADLNDIKCKLEQANKTIEDRDRQLEELSKIDANSLQDTITKLQEENKTAKADFEKQMYQLKINNALKLAITDAQDFDIILSQLDMEKISLDDKGALVGLEEQINTLRENKAYLFKQEEQKTTYIGQKINNSNKDKGNVITKEMFNRMSYKEKTELYNTNYELYKSLAK